MPFSSWPASESYLYLFLVFEGGKVSFASPLKTNKRFRAATNVALCVEVCPQTRYVSSPCGGFLGLLRGVRCKVERTVYAPCPDLCCPGLRLVGGRCLDS